MNFPHYRGVRYEPTRGGNPWRVQIHLNKASGGRGKGKTIHVGRFRTAQLAAMARDEECRKLGFPEAAMNFPNFDTSTHKECIGCRKILPLDCYLKGSGRMGRNARCRDCQSLWELPVSAWKFDGTDDERAGEPKYDHAEIQARIAVVRAEKIAKGHQPIGPGIVPWTPPLSSKRRVHDYMSADRHEGG